MKRLLHLRRLILPLLLVAVALTPFLAFGVISVVVFEAMLAPLYHERTEIVANGVRRRMEFSVQMFGDLSMLRDVETVLEEARAASGEIDFIAVTDLEGPILYQTAIDLDRPDGLQGLLAESNPGVVSRTLLTMIGAADAALSRVFEGEGIDAPALSRRVGDFVITSLPLMGVEGPVGFVHAGVNVSLFDRIRRDVVMDAATLFFATLVIGYECVWLLFSINIARPRRMLKFLARRLRAKDLRHVAAVDSAGGVAALAARVNAFIRAAALRTAALGDRAPPGLRHKGAKGPKTRMVSAADYIRLPLFLFFLAEAILRPFLPLFLAELPGGAAAAPEAQVGAAMAAFMLASIFGVVVGSVISDRLAARPVFLIGVAVCAAGMAAHVVLETAFQAILARGLSGLGYGVVYAAAQIYVAQHADKGRRARGFSLFLAVVVAAEISGPAIGGILADRFGFQPAFLAAVGALAVAALAAYRILPGRRPDSPPPPSTKEGRMSGGARFLMLTLCFSIPAKLLLTGGLFLLVPLAVADAGGEAIDAGRVVMLYGVVILFTAGRLALIADSRDLFGHWMFFGGAISGVGLCLPAFFPNLIGLSAAVALFGLGQSMSIPSQITFMLSVSRREVARHGAGAVLGAFRFFERVGSLLGPVVGAALLAAQSPSEALFTLGAYTLIAASIGAAYFLIVGEQDEDEAIDALLVEA